MKMKYPRSTSGYSLVESLIAMAISTVTISGVVAVFVMNQRVAYESTKISQITGQARLFSDTVARDIRMAVGMTDTFQVYSVTDGDMILRLPAINEYGNLIDLEGATDSRDLTTFDHVIYYVDDSEEPAVVIKEVFPAPSSSRESQRRVFGNIVTMNSYQGTFAILPDALGAFVVQYQFVDSQEFQGREYSLPISGSIRLRNKR